MPGELYRPVLLARLLGLPAPGPALVDTEYWILLAAAAGAGTPRHAHTRRPLG